MTALLHTHSYYSLLRGIPSPRDLAGTLRVLIDEEVYLRCRTNLATKAAILVTGRLDRGRDSGEALFWVSDVQRLDRLALRSSEAATPG